MEEGTDVSRVGRGRDIAITRMSRGAINTLLKKVTNVSRADTESTRVCKGKIHNFKLLRESMRFVEERYRSISNECFDG